MRHLNFNGARASPPQRLSTKKRVFNLNNALAPVLQVDQRSLKRRRGGGTITGGIGREGWNERIEAGESFLLAAPRYILPLSCCASSHSFILPTG